MVMPAASQEPRRAARTDEQVVGALAGHLESGLAVAFGGETRFLRPLSIAGERKWKALVGPKVAQSAVDAERLGDIDDAAGLAAILNSSIDDVLDLIVAFDALGAGSINRDWLEEHASGIEARDCLEVLLDSVYPPLPGGETRPAPILLGVLVRGEAARSVSPTSTSGSSAATRGSTARKTSRRR